MIFHIRGRFFLFSPLAEMKKIVLGGQGEHPLLFVLHLNFGLCNIQFSRGMYDKEEG